MTHNSSTVTDGEVVFVSMTQSERAEEDRPSKAIDPNEKHLCTNHLLSDLKGRTISGAVVTIAAQVGQFVLNLGSIMILARLLTPKDFGLFAMVTTVMSFLRVFKDAGLSTATVQREGITYAQVSNLFWINVAMSGAISLLMAAGSPAIAWFYREPRLVGITLILSSTFLLSGLTVQHTALLNRQMRFKAMAVIQVGSMLVGTAVGVVMAWTNYGYWALVWGNFVTVAASVVLTWIAIPWRPQAPIGGSGTRSLIGFGANLTTGGFLYSFARGADALLIGRFCGPDSLGLYTRAGALLNRPLDQFLGPLQSVFVPALSRIQMQPERYRRTFLRVYEAMALVSCLSTGLLFALSSPTNSCCAWREVGTVGCYFCRPYNCGVLHAARCRCNVAIHQPRTGQRLVIFELTGFDHYRCLFRGWTPLWPCRSRDRLFDYRPVHRYAASLLFCRTGWSCQCG